MATSYVYRQHLYGLIMAGGGGTRLWPLSREATPKQFLKMFGTETLVEITAKRFSSFLPWDKIYVSTSSIQYKKNITKLLPRLPKDNVIVEPTRKDSGPAYSLGAMKIFSRDPDAVIVNEASDHFIDPLSEFKKTVYSAANIAYKENVMIAIGIAPTYPHTGMGHMKIGKKYTVSEHKNVYKLDKFVEKPKLEIAKRYTASGKYLWNAALWVWRADSLISAIEKHAPDIYAPLFKIGKAIGTRDEQKVITKEFMKMPKIAIDYAIAEKANNFLMLVGEFHWTDIGDWNEVWKNLPKDETGSVVIGDPDKKAEIISIDTSDTLIHRNGRTIAVIDVDNIVIVDTEDALLVCSKSKAQSVKQIVEKLKEKNRKDLL